MKITIEPPKFLNVLIHHGLAESDAKALLFDLIMESQGITTTAYVPEPAAEQEEVTVTRPQANVEEGEDEDEDQDSDFTVEAVSNKPKLRKPVRMNFSAFGGTDDKT